MTTPDHLNLLTARHLNQGLFSDYYLDDVVPTLPEWNQGGAVYQQMVALRAGLRERLERLKPETLDEAQLEDLWVKPVLEALGHHWSVQVKIRYRDKGFRKPDYVFTRTQAEAEALSNAIYDPAQIAHTLAVGDAKRWGAKLDQASGSERNPSQQIDEYLRYSERPWGILTDGRIWRLYHRESSKDNAYYAVDLPALLTSTHDEANTWFLYFYLFFQAQAFEGGAWLETILQQSVNHAEGLSERLEDEVYEALTFIAQGFFSYRRNRLKPGPETLREVYTNSLIFLYRLLFILYAESRGVLPMEKDSLYARQRSLQILLSDAFVNQLEGDSHFFRRVDEAGTYERLSALFLAIDQGDEQYEVSPYNGRLFSDEDHPFLADKRVGDAYLLPALDRLARVDRLVRREGKARRVLVDYRDLDVRHLGAIYERLLEYELDQATTALALKDGKYIPATAGAKAVVEAGALYLRTGNNERKTTGSYYTPDYIVQFIVERTLEPLLTAITARHADFDSEGHWVIRDAAALRAGILGINVLDPATGSGHFMVGAVAYIAEWLRRLALHPADLGADEDELIYWKRQVVTNCIYGVDVNPLAVELAKLSLWLTTLAKGRPLSFLDHHVRPGNTLVGELPPHPLTPSPADQGRGTPDSPPRSAGEGPGVGMYPSTQLPLFDPALVSAAVTRMSAIETTVARVVGDVKGQEQSWADLQTALDPLRRAADAATASYFPTRGVGTPFMASAGPGDSGLPFPIPMGKGQGGEASAASGGEVLAAQHRFFHWGLTFPEVFFNADGALKAEPGFDAIIGNPPYVRQERIQPIKPYLEANYQVYSGTADLYLYFYERALQLLKPGQRVGYITSGTFMNSNSAVSFRQFIRSHAGFDTVVDFGAVQPFKGADLATNAVITIISKGQKVPAFRSLLIEGRQAPASLKELLDKDGFDCPSDLLDNPEWRLQSVELLSLGRKLFETGINLQSYIDGEVYRGVTTGLNDAFVIDEATRQRLIQENESSAEIIKVLRRGQDLRPWHQMNSGLYLIFTRRGINIDNYPAIKHHLEQYRQRLEPQPQNWNTREHGTWEGRKAGTYAWYEIQDQTAYFAEFEKAKILWPDIARFPRFSRNQGYYLGNTAFMIASSSYALLGLLQSRTMWFAISQIATPLNIRLGLWRYRVIQQFVERLPIPVLTAAQESTLGALAEEITALAASRYRLHESARQRIGTDLGAGGKLNEALQAWWELPDLTAFRAEVKKSFKAEVPVRERSEWESWLREQGDRHRALTDQIIDRETRLNAVVYQAFDLLPDEIALVERATKYPYGAV
jgi:hypothetical protein